MKEKKIDSIKIRGKISEIKIGKIIENYSGENNYPELRDNHSG